MRLGLFAFARPTFDVPLATEMAEGALATLRDNGVEVIGDATLMMDAAPAEARINELTGQPLEGIVVLQASFCDAQMIRRLGERFECPIAIWAFPEPRTGDRLRLNAFCGLNLAAHALGLAGRTCGYHYAPPDVAPNLTALFGARPVPASRPATDPSPDEATRVLSEVAGKYGLIGTHPAGFDTCAFDEAELAQTFGAEIARIPMDRLFADARAVDAGRVDTIHAETGAALTGLDTMEPEPLDKALRSYAALSDLCGAEDLKGVAVRCWPETFTEYGCAVCGAMARVTDEGVPAACEADVPGAIAGRLMQAAAGTPSWLVDVVDMDTGTDTGVVWHCGLAPAAMRDPDTPAEAALHSNRLKPLLRQFALRPGQVTFCRISQARGTRTMVIGSAEMLKEDRAFSGTAGVFRPAGGVGPMRDRMIAAGLEHHLTLAYGDHRAVLESIAARIGMPVLDLTA